MSALPDAASARKVLDFWFSERVEKQWFDASPEFDREIIEKFGDLYRQAHAGELAGWLATAETALALVIVLDQFPRNMFRGTPEAFQSDGQAREVSRIALAKAFDNECSEKARPFFYLPLMHSENLRDQAECVELYRRLEDKENLKYAVEHRDIIARFGRFPHRNRILGRESSAEEEEFLKTHKGF